MALSSPQLLVVGMSADNEGDRMRVINAVIAAARDVCEPNSLEGVHVNIVVLREALAQFDAINNEVE